MPVFHGTDTSNNQGPGVVGIGPDLVAMGAQGWWHKATQGSSFRDAYWPTCRQARVDVGLRYGGPYHWLTPTSAVADQFHNFRDYVGPLWDGEMIQLDIEEGGLSDAQVIDAYELWEGEWPGRVAHYCGRFFNSIPHQGYLIDRMKARYGDAWRWWLPWYTDSFPDVPWTPLVWQWAGGDTGVIIPSIGRRVDSNEIHDLDALELASGLFGPPPPPPPPPPGADMPTILVVTGLTTMLSPSPTGGGHSHASWIETEGEVDYLRQFWPVETITQQQFGGIRLIGDAPASVKAAMHQGASNMPAGPKGDKGDKGDQGPKGDKGDPGSSSNTVAPHHHDILISSGPVIQP